MYFDIVEFVFSFSYFFFIFLIHQKFKSSAQRTQHDCSSYKVSPIYSNHLLR